MSRLIFLDVETTGLNPDKNDIIELAAAIYVDGIFQIDFSLNCQPMNYDNIENEALEVHGITVADMKTFQTAQEMGTQLGSILINHYGGKEDPYIMVAHNLPFDKKFLEYWMLKTGNFGLSHYFCSYREIDTLAYVKYAKAMGHIKSKRNSLGAVCRELGIVNEKKHRALHDVRAMAQMFFAIENIITKSHSPKEQQLAMFEF